MQIQTDRALIPVTGDAVRYLTVKISAPQRERRADRVPAAVSFVLDRSGSMAGSKIDKARKAVDHAIELLDDRDEFAVVVYDSEIDVVLERVSATPEAKSLASRRLRASYARGNTNLSGGWQAGAACAPDRVLLLTDGLANAGVTDSNALAAMAAAFKARGIVTSTFGVGGDFDETLLARIATEGGGHFYYIENARQIPDLLASELGETLEVVAHDAWLEVACGQGVDATTLNEFPTQKGGGGLRVRLGDLVAGQELTVVIAVRCAARPIGERAFVDVSLTDRAAALYRGAMRVEWESVNVQADLAQPINGAVILAAAELIAARRRAEALELNRAGRVAEASALLKDVISAILAMAPGVPELESIAATLRDEVVEYGERLMASALKEKYFASYSMSRGRDHEGKANRAPGPK